MTLIHFRHWKTLEHLLRGQSLTVKLFKKNSKRQSHRLNTKSKMKLFSILGLYSTVNSQSFEPNPNWSDGQCPDLPAPENFDTDGFFGEWQM